jgi:hypothetical protein
MRIADFKRATEAQVICHLSFVICHLSLKKCSEPNDKCKMNNEQWKMARASVARLKSAIRNQDESLGSGLLIPNCKWVHRHPQLDSSRRFPKNMEAGLVESHRLRSVRTSGYGCWSKLERSRRPLN